MESFLKEYLATLKVEKNLSRNTINSYKSDLTSFLNFISQAGIDDLSDVKTSHISSFFKLLKDAGLNETSAARYFSSLKDFLNIFINVNTLNQILLTEFLLRKFHADFLRF